MRSCHRAVLSSVAMLLLSVTSGATPPFTNQWGPFTGRVVEAETGQPIPGAIFVVIWLRNMTLPFHDVQRFNDARAAVADAGGSFEIPERNRPFLSSFVEPPNLICVAPGYAPFEDVGAQHAPMHIPLTPLPLSRRGPSASWTETLGLIPEGRRTELGEIINARRRELGLASIDFGAGNLERGRK